MASYKSYLASIEKTPEGVRKAIEYILAADSPFQVGNSVPKQLAKGALSLLNAVEENTKNRISRYEEKVAKHQLLLAKYTKAGNTTRVATEQSLLDSAQENLASLKAGKATEGYDPAVDLAKKLESAFNLLTKGTDRLKWSKYGKSVREDQEDIKKKIGETSEWLANRLDFSGGTISEEKQKEILASSVVQEKQAELKELISKGDTFGIDTTKAQEVYKNASGYLVSGTTDTGSSLALKERTMREGQTTTVQQQADGTYAVVGADGSVLQDKIGTLQEALIVQTERQSGGTPTISPTTEQPTTEAATTTTTAVPTEATTTGATTEAAASTGSITFKDGLTDKQKEELTTLSKKPADQWTDTDKANWAYGTNNSAVPTGTTATTTTTDEAAATATTGEAALPEDIQKLMEGLSADQQEILKTTYNALISGDEAAKADASKALEDAIALADPYFKSQIRLAQDEILRSTAATGADAASEIGQLQTRIDQTKEDLIYNREQLTLDEQASLASQLREYQDSLSSLQTQYQEAGLIFSSPRAQAEQQLAEQQKLTAESTTRQAQRALRELGTGSLRDIQAATEDIGNVSRKAAEQTLATMRSGEAVLGTANLPKLEGVSALGDITGTIEEDRQKAILDLEQSLLQRTASTDVLA